MKVHIFDVEQGECNIIQLSTGHTIMIGIGHNASTNWHPSDWLKKNKLFLTTIVLSNLDEDHLSDLPNFEPNQRPYLIMRNFYLNPDWVAYKKSLNGPLGNGIKTAIHWLKNVFTGLPIPFDYGVEVKHFYHHPSKFIDTNNLSIVTFISHNNVGILFPSDIEKKGIEEFLKDPSFINCLKRTNILLAPHHGRKDEYSADMLNYCTQLDVVVISDKSIQHDTQDHNLYGQHPNVRGITFNDGTKRKVLTTRNEGKITFEIIAPSQYSFKIKESY